MKDLNLKKSKDSIFLKRISSKKEISKSDDCDGYFITSSEAEARRIIDTLKGTKKIIALNGNGNKFNRRALETLKINYLVSPESGKKTDSLKQRDSGLNHVLAKIATKKQIPIVINMSEVSGLKGIEKSKRIARIIQNIKICKKAKCRIKIASLSKNKIFDEKSRNSFGLSLGMETKQAKQATSFNQ